MKILIACEFSGIVRDAFRKLGHDAWSCDILPCEDASAYHYQRDVREILDDNWDMMIAHPPCTYLCVPGAHYLHTRPNRWDQMLNAKNLFMSLLTVDINKICIENPVPHKYAKLPQYTQIIHPWQFGQEYSKRTCLWLKNLQPLIPTKIMQNHGDRYYRLDGSSSNSKWYAKSNSHERSRTFTGIAQAMAEQWG